MSIEKLNQVLLHASARVGANLDEWRAGPGIDGLEKALGRVGGGESIVEMIKAAGLLGLGGSGFPTWRKWEAMAARPGQGDKYLICNGNEDEPGTFKDRLLMEECPHQLIEGATIAALAVGANKVIFYVNPHLKAALQAMELAVEEWLACELPKRVGEALGRPVEYCVVRSSGHYIGGEESAAISTIEGSFPFPRRKPPYPVESGVHGHPTLINNVETLSNVPHILRNGVEWYRDRGLGEACGTKIYSLSGDVLHPGAYELPMGTPLSELVYHYGGGMLVGKELKAVFTGGPSNTILTPKDIDVPMDYPSVAARHSALGTGAMIVVSEGTGIVKRVTEYVNFFAESSCGQCPSCKTGTYYISLLLDKIDTGRGTRSDLDSLESLCRILPGSGRCHLVDGAVKVLESSLYHFRGEYEQALL
ncbi:complex I 51 kDa subunit family protein [Endothiovibrio diazotrophicus]